MNLNGVYKKMTGEILALIQEMIECDCNNETKSSQCSDKILLFVDSFSNSVAGSALNYFKSNFKLKTSLTMFNKYFSSISGMRSLMTQTYPVENFEINNFSAFIETYALALTYEYKMQYTALQALQIMSTNINIKLFLLRQYDYEVPIKC